MRMTFKRKLAIPMEVKEMYPLTPQMSEIFMHRSEEIKSIFDGASKKLLLIIGPCSADNEDSAMDYLTRLREIQEKVEEKIFIIPRLYTNKPRTTGAGYKGMLHQPNPLASPDLFKGLEKKVSEGGIRPDHESSSSLEKLIHYPFDYVLKYLLKFDSYGEEQLSDMSIVKGNVAHQYIHDLVEKGNKDIDQMQRIHTAEFEDGIKSAVLKKGAILLPRENGLEWGKFKNILQISVDRLLGLIRRNRYQIVGSEVEVLTDLPVIGSFKGYIDLLLQDTDGKYVIIDFKSSESSTYKHKMEERNIMQLILYKEAVQSIYGRVSVYGYWLLSQYTFLTESDSVLGDNVIPYHTDPAEVATLKDLFAQIKNSYTYRMTQIRQGKIEEGEMMQLADIEYYQDQEAKNLYPLAKDYNKHDLKGRPYGNENITLKGGLE